MNKRTILKSIDLFFKSHKEEKNKDPEIKKKEKKSILKVIDTIENKADRTTDTTFPTPSDPIMNEANNFKVNKVDYSIKDLTKREDIKSDEVQPPREEDININNILNDLDDRLNESDNHHVLNILTTRSSKGVFRESALIEFRVNNNSYVMSLIVEKEDNSYIVTLKSSYGKEIYASETTLDKLYETVYYPFQAIRLRDKFTSLLNEEAKPEMVSNYITNYILDKMKTESFTINDENSIVEDTLNSVIDKYGIEISEQLEQETRDAFKILLQK